MDETITEGEGRTRVWLKRANMGSDVVLLLGGGEEHVGCVVVCEPGKESKTIVLGTHRDMEVAEPLAREMAGASGKTVVCVAGIHLDEITAEEIEEVRGNCRKLARRLGNPEVVE